MTVISSSINPTKDPNPPDNGDSSSSKGWVIAVAIVVPLVVVSNILVI